MSFTNHRAFLSYPLKHCLSCMMLKFPISSSRTSSVYMYIYIYFFLFQFHFFIFLHCIWVISSCLLVSSFISYVYNLLCYLAISIFFKCLLKNFYNFWIPFIIYVDSTFMFVFRSFFFFFFFGQTHGMWKFLGQGSNPCHRCGNTESITCYTTQRLPIWSFLCNVFHDLKQICFIISKR